MEYLILSLKISPRNQEFCLFSIASIQISTKNYLKLANSFLKCSLCFLSLVTALVKALLGLSSPSVSRMNFGFEVSECLMAYVATLTWSSFHSSVLSKFRKVCPIPLTSKISFPFLSSRTFSSIPGSNSSLFKNVLICQTILQ